MINTINNFIDDYKDLRVFLMEKGQFSLENNIENHLRKVMLLACASYYENEIQDMIKSFVNNNSRDERILHFVSKKAIARQYHTYFDWEKRNINTFLALFGNEFKDLVQNEIKGDEELKKQMEAFLTIRNERNKMVHNNFISYQLDKTFEEIIKLNEQADKFIDYLKQHFDGDV